MLGWRRAPKYVRSAAALAAAALLGLLPACAAPGTRLAAEIPVAVLRISAPIHQPVFSFGTDTLLGLTDDNRIAKVDVPAQAARADAPTTFSPALDDIGRNITISPQDDSTAFVAQPASERVAVVDIDALQPIGTLTAGPQPSYLASDAGYEVLLALSADRSTVTAVDLHRNDVMGSQPVSGEPAQTTIEGSERGRVVEFHLVRPDGIAHYQGGRMPVEKKADMGIGVEAAATDPVKVSRAYLAERGSDRLLAVDTRGGSDLRVVGSAALGEQVREVAADHYRIYAATDTRLVVLASHAFEGYRDGRIPVLRSFEYRRELPLDTPGGVPLAGLAVGRDHVYLAVAGQPYLVQVAKPHV